MNPRTHGTEQDTNFQSLPVARASYQQTSTSAFARLQRQNWPSGPALSCSAALICPRTALPLRTTKISGPPDARAGGKISQHGACSTVDTTIAEAAVPPLPVCGSLTTEHRAAYRYHIEHRPLISAPAAAAKLPPSPPPQMSRSTERRRTHRHWTRSRRSPLSAAPRPLDLGNAVAATSPPC